jgi:hypothetical protein
MRRDLTQRKQSQRVDDMDITGLVYREAGLPRQTWKEQGLVAHADCHRSPSTHIIEGLLPVKDVLASNIIKGLLLLCDPNKVATTQPQRLALVDTLLRKPSRLT